MKFRDVTRRPSGLGNRRSIQLSYGAVSDNSRNPPLFTDNLHTFYTPFRHPMELNPEAIGTLPRVFGGGQ